MQIYDGINIFFLWEPDNKTKEMIIFAYLLAIFA